MESKPSFSIVVVVFNGVAMLALVAVATPELLHRGGKPHTHQEQKAQDKPLGRGAIEAVVSVAPLQVKAWSAVKVDDNGPELPSTPFRLS
jgi:hypothetical protein